MNIQHLSHVYLNSTNKLGEFVDNLDAIEVLYFLTTIFFKISIHMFAVVRAIQKLTLVKNSRVFILPVAAIALYLGMTMSSNILVHIETSLKMIQYNLFVPLFIILPSI
jgi:spore germination protein KB